MAQRTNKIVVRILDDISPSPIKLRNISRSADGLSNMFINELGQVEKRKGYTKYNQTEFAVGYPIIGIHRFYNEETGAKQFLVACRDRIYKVSPSYPHEGTEIPSNEGV